MIFKKPSFLFVLILIAGLLFGCSSKKSNNSDLKKQLVAFVSNTDKIIGFGYIDIETIKNKSQISKISELNKFLEKTLTPIEQAVKLKDKVYFAFAGPISDNGPEVNYVFVNINNKDSLEGLLGTIGYTFEKSKENPNIKIYNDESMAIGFDDNTLILVNANSNNDTKTLLISAFESFKKPNKNKDVASILKSDKDILLAANLEQMNATNPYFLKNQSEDKKKEMRELTKDGYWTLGIDFNKGNLIAKMDISRVNGQLKDLYLLKDKASSEIKQNLGPDSTQFAMALSLNMKNVESLMNRFGDTKSRIQFIPGPIVLKALIAGEKLSDLTNGNLGFMVSNKIDRDALLGMGLYDMHYFLGLGDNGQNIIDLIDTLAGADQIHDLGDGYYRLNSGILRIDNNNLVYHNNDSLKEDFKTGPIEIADDLEHFGEQPLSVYVNLKNTKNISPTKIPNAVDQLLDYATLNGNNNEVVLKIMLKNQEENVLKQFLDAYKQEVISRVENTPGYN